MPITKSAKKALRQTEKRQKQNLLKKEVYKELLKKIEKAASQGKRNDIVALMPALSKAVDKAAKTHVIAKNKAARLKSRVARLANETK